MATVPVYSQKGRKTSDLELADAIFAIEPNADAIHHAKIN